MPHCHCFWSNIIQETCPLVHLTVIDFLRISSPTPPSDTHSVQGGNPRQLRCPHPKGPQRHHTSRASSPAHDPPQFSHQTGRDRVAAAETAHSHTGQWFLQATGLPGHFLSFLKSVQYNSLKVTSFCCLQRTWLTLAPIMCQALFPGSFLLILIVIYRNHH